MVGARRHGDRAPPFFPITPLCSASGLRMERVRSVAMARGTYHAPPRSSTRHRAGAISEARSGEPNQLADVLVCEKEACSEEEVAAGHDPGHVRRLDPRRVDQIVGAGGDQQVIEEAVVEG